LVTNVRGKVRTVSVSARTWAESHAGGGAGLNALGDVSSKGVQFAAVTLPGFVPIHIHGPVGTLV
jgi:hypothetical protein